MNDYGAQADLCENRRLISQPPPLPPLYNIFDPPPPPPLPPPSQVHVLYGGTQLMEAKDGDGKEGCCECYVLRTGFSSSQGKLVRKIGTTGVRCDINVQPKPFGCAVP
jgi:magnesium-transporting ATPase (P-type)